MRALTRRALSRGLGLLDESGETMVETLISILISSLALLLLATAIGTSVNIVTASRSHMEEFYQNESSLTTNPKVSSSTLTFGVPLEAGRTSGDVTVYAPQGDAGIVLYERSGS